MRTLDIVTAPVTAALAGAVWLVAAAAGLVVALLARPTRVAR